MSKTLLAIAGCLFSATIAGVTVTTDSYIGRDDHGYGDRIGPPDYEMNSIDISIVPGFMTVSVITDFSGHANDKIGYGDFLIGTWDGDPLGQLNPVYAVLLDSRKNSAGTASVYDVAGVRLITTDEMMSAVGGIFRNGQIVAAEPSGIDPIGIGSWWTDPGLISFTIPISKLDMSRFDSVSWGPTCGNDVIIGKIQEPHIVSLFLGGLLLCSISASIKK